MMGRKALAVALLVGGSTLIASPAFAHSSIVDSTPAEDAVLTELPATFEVSANEDLLSLDGSTSGFGMQVKDAAGAFYGDGCLTVDGPTLSMPAALGESGSYELIYQVVSADGHAISGEIPFKWQAPDNFEPAEGTAEASTCGAASTEAEEQESADSTPLWIIGALVAAGVAVAAGLLFNRADKTPPPSE